MLTTIPAGWFSDKVGERIAISLGFFLDFLAMMPNDQGGQLCWVGRHLGCLSGFAGFGWMSPAYQSLLSKVLPEKNYAARVLA